MRIPLAMPALVLLLGAAASADLQRIAPGTGLQNAVVIDTGTNGICETAASAGDIQAADVGGGARNRSAIRCGPNRDAETAAQGDDVQLIAVGGICRNANAIVIDTGSNGIPETSPIGDDTFAPNVALGVPPRDAPCVVAGADGIAQTAAPSGDDNQLIPAGIAEPSTDVVRCGPNGLSETTANNVDAGDDVQLVPVGGACTMNQPIVDSGLDGIATTRAEGVDLRIELVKPLKLEVSAKRATASKLVKVKVRNVEFGAAAPASRGFRIRATGGSCPGGTVTQIDADPKTPGLQAVATVALGKTAKASLVASVRVDNVTVVDKKNPFRCTFDVSVIAVDTDPDVDDAANDDTNSVPVVLEAVDQSDL